MNADDRIALLESEIMDLKYQIKAQQSIIAMRNTPIWAIEAAKAAKESGAMESPVGNSFDYYILIDLLHKKGIL